MWIEIGFALLAAYFLSFHSASPELPKMTLEELTNTVYSEDESRHYLLAMFGYVFNVSSAPEFYAPGQKYEQFRGHDCTRAFATSSLDADDLDRDLEGLQQGDFERADESYQTTYLEKYPIVATLTDPPYDISLRPQRKAYGGNTVNHGVKGECPFTKQVNKIKDVLYSLLPPLLTGA